MVMGKLVLITNIHLTIPVWKIFLLVKSCIMRANIANICYDNVGTKHIVDGMRLDKEVFMLLATHKCIGEMIYTAFNERFDIILDQQSLLRGSTAPDIRPLMFVMKHSPEGAMWLVEKKIQWLISQDPGRISRYNKVFSYTLGIVLHFVCDFFCRAHNDKKYTNLARHIAYEKKLVRFGDNYKDVMQQVFLSLEPFEEAASCEDILHFVKEKHLVYLQQEESMETDLEYASIMSKMVTHMILQCCAQAYNANPIPVPG